ncbi:hypothetical protein [Microbulbifer sp. HZ11]|uniref:hypothetical protein n=1 Tax=Microbulbifer sp. HZ11 TaxID=1453501 RepID=UPI0012DCBFFF|nr:hypothetical protein [Microbulbifer sp. HZ11]
MKREKLIILAVVLLPLFLVLLLCVKSSENWNVFSANGEMQESYVTLASEVQLGKYTNTQIAEKFKSLAEAEKKISNGAKLIQSSYYFWSFLFVVIAALQLMVLFRALDAHNNHGQ